MGAAIVRHPVFVGAPAELRRLHAFGNKTLIGFGRFERWVSRSAIWMPLTPSFWASRPQPSRLFGSSNGVWLSRAISSSACLTNQDTMPGLAPQVETAVGPPGLLCFAAS